VRHETACGRTSHECKLHNYFYFVPRRLTAPKLVENRQQSSRMHLASHSAPVRHGTIHLSKCRYSSLPGSIRSGRRCAGYWLYWSRLRHHVRRWLAASTTKTSEFEADNSIAIGQRRVGGSLPTYLPTTAVATNTRKDRRNHIRVTRTVTKLGWEPRSIQISTPTNESRTKNT
jgi:hypothetical protein